MIAVVLFIAVMIGFAPVTMGQGTVTFSSINQSQFDAYVGQAAWIGLVDTGGTAGFSYPTITSSGYAGGSALQSSVILANGGGTAGLMLTVINGQFGSTGQTAGSSVSSVSPLIGLAFGIVSPNQNQSQTAAVSDLYIVGDVSNYQGFVADTASTPFSGMLCSFNSASSTFNTSFNIVTDLDSTTRIFVIGISAEAVPEPSTFALVGIGLAGLVIFARKR